MPIGSFLDGLKDNVVNPEGIGAYENENRGISKNAYQAEIGQREEHSEYAAEHGA